MTTETIHRSCPTCEASCGLVMEVDTEAKQVISIKGDPDNHRSKGYVCAKSQAFRYIYEDPERLTKPVKKVDGQWQEIGWEEALSETAERLAAIREQYGKDSIAMYYGNPNGHNFSTQIYTQMFITLLNTERFFSAGSVDQQPKNLSCELLYGNGWVFPIPDIDHTDFFVCMGGNPMVSQGSLMSAPDIGSRLKAIQQRGGKIAVIDPRRTETADVADQHIFIRPGTDAFLLMAFVNELFATHQVKPGRLLDFTDGIEKLEPLSAPFSPSAVAAITGVPAQRLRQLVKEFCAASAPVLYGRIGLCTQQFGTLASWLVDVINILTGRLDAKGGAMFPRPATAHNDPAAAPPELGYNRWQSKARGFPEYMSMLPASLMAEEMELQGEHQVRALITVAGNPVLSVPNGKRIHAAMEKLDFVVAFDFYINETTSGADIIIPSTTQLEHSNYDFMFTSTCVRNFAQYSPKTFEPPEGALDQWQIINEVTARMHGMTRADLEAMMLDGMIAQLQANAPELAHLSVEDIKQKTAGHDGPERLLDIMLRAGPYGDKFGGERPDARATQTGTARDRPWPAGTALSTAAGHQIQTHRYCARYHHRRSPAPARSTQKRPGRSHATDWPPPYSRHELVAAQPEQLRARQEPLHAVDQSAGCAAHRAGGRRHGADTLTRRRIRGGSCDQRWHHARRGQPAARLRPHLPQHAAIRGQHADSRHFRE
jgi:anaerobic selenocysteine-containing dehydrogenase